MSAVTGQEREIWVFRMQVACGCPRGGLDDTLKSGHGASLLDCGTITMLAVPGQERDIGVSRLLRFMKKL